LSAFKKLLFLKFDFDGPFVQALASVIPATDQKLRRARRPSQLKANAMPPTRNIRYISALSLSTMLPSAGG
jgi:hypothetical protein